MKTFVRSMVVSFSICLLMAISATAQERYQIVRAEYGAGHRFADVTARVRSMVRGEMLDFRVSHNSLDSDPAHGHHKELRLQVSDARGQIREMVFEDDSQVHLFIGGYGQGQQPGANNGGLTILRAEYGIGPRVRDVTRRLGLMVRGDALQVRVNNDNMGGDPAEGQTKELEIWYLYNGRSAHTNVREKDVLTLPIVGDAAYYQDHLRITRAQYGADYRFADVTSLLNSQLRNDTLQIRVTNDNMGGDPAHDERKVLTVFYIYNGQQARAFVNENEVLTLPMANVQGGRGDRDDDDDEYYRRFWPGRSANELRVLQASWGAEGRDQDVTGRLNQMVRGNELNVAVNDGTMGGDPTPSVSKRLRLIYMLRGLRYETNVPEGGSLVLP